MTASYCKEYQYDFNESKCQVLIIGNQNHQFKLNDVNLEIVKNVKYLGKVLL